MEALFVSCSWRLFMSASCPLKTYYQLFTYALTVSCPLWSCCPLRFYCHLSTEALYVSLMSIKFLLSSVHLGSYCQLFSAACLWGSLHCVCWYSAGFDSPTDTSQQWLEVTKGGRAIQARGGNSYIRATLKLYSAGNDTSQYVNST